ncbi:helix-turn-helix transcriptional regulator, partial [Vibrio breoganii]
MSEFTVTKSTLVRLFELYRKIPSPKGAGLSTRKLHEYLIEEGFEVSKRTVERDLLKLQEITGIYAEKTPEGNIWKNSIDNQDLLPTMQPTEALLLIAAERLLKHAMPPESKMLLENRIHKAHKTLDKSNRLGKWQDKLYIVEGQIPHATTQVDSAILSNIYESVLNETMLNLSYTKLDTEESKRYCLNPLAIVAREHGHYLVATKKESPNKPQLFNFRRVTQAESLANRLIKPRGFNVSEYIESNPTGWLLSQFKHRIEIRVKWFAYDWLKYNQLHSSQTLTKLDDEWYLLTLETNVTYDLVGWVLRFSTDTIAESPRILVDEIKERLTNMAERYRARSRT